MFPTRYFPSSHQKWIKVQHGASSITLEQTTILCHLDYLLVATQEVKDGAALAREVGWRMVDGVEKRGIS